jgi:hypothetical protein
MRIRFVEVKFKPWDRKAFTYELAGDDEIAAGDQVEVMTPRNGLASATVVRVFDAKPAHLEHIELKRIERVLPRAPQPPTREPN